MKLSAVYLKAAKTVAKTDAKGWHCPACSAVSRALNASHYDSAFARAAFHGFGTAFKPPHLASYDYWFGPVRGLAHQEHRIYALLFMRELAKEQGL